MQGLLYYEMLDFTEAHASLDKALDIDPHSVAALKIKAMTYAEAARFDEAIECCDRCLELNSILTDIQQLREKYVAGLKKHGRRQPLSGINFKKQFPESEKTPQQTPVQKPAAQGYTADLVVFHSRFSQCAGGANKGTLAVNMDRIIALVKEDPDRALRYVTRCCSDSSVSLKNLQMIGFIGIALQMHCGDSRALDMIRKRAQDLQGK
jgi:tetratricopeptide (TPR) repeat protein